MALNCKIHYNQKGEILHVEAENGERSALFDALTEMTKGDKQAALHLYAITETEEFKDFKSVKESSQKSRVKKLVKTPKQIGEKYIALINKIKIEQPMEYWSVDIPSIEDIESAANEGRIVDVKGGMGIVMPDGNMVGLFKYDPTEKGTAAAVQEARVKMGGIKMDNFDGYLTKIYQRNGFRVAARLPFNEEYAPVGWDKEQHGTPDVVFMIYDPGNKLDLQEKTFSDYDDAQAYRDSFTEEARALKSGKQNTAFFEGKAKEASSNIPYNPVLNVDQNSPVAKAYQLFTAGGNFTGHISKMIAGFQEKQKQVAEAIVKGSFKSFLDIGTSEGGMIKTVASQDKNMVAVGVDPNLEMQKNFNSTPEVPNAEFRLEAFQGSWTEDDGTVIREFKSDRKFDVVNEDFTFQFVNNNRAKQVAGVKELMTPDGIFITSEKFHTANEAANEAKKYDHQRKYFSPDQLTEDKQTIVSGMADDMVNDVEYYNILKDNFRFVVEFWNAGNFKGYLASDNEAVLNKFKEDVGDLTSEFTDTTSLTLTEEAKAAVKKQVSERTEAAAHPLIFHKLISKLKETRLANEVYQLTNKEIEDKLAELGVEDGKSVEGVTMITNGFVYNGDVYLNVDHADNETLIHEFNHLYTDWLKNNRPEIYNKGIELVKENKDGALDDVIAYVKETQPDLVEGSEAFYEEVLTASVGRQGAKILEENANSPFGQWLQEFWDTIKNMLGLSQYSTEQVMNMTLDEFVNASAVDLLSGKPIEELFANRILGNEKVKIEVNYLEEAKKEQLIKDGKLEEQENLDFMAGKQVITSSPDDMLVGNVNVHDVNGKNISATRTSEGSGGLHFVTKFGEVWAFRSIKDAKKYVTLLNSALKANGGKTWFVLTKGSDAKLLSNPQGVTNSLNVTTALMDAGFISTSDMRKAVTEAVQQYKDTINIGLKDSTAQIKKKVNNFFQNEKAVSFEIRGNVLRQILTNLNSTESFKKNRKEIANFLGVDPNNKFTKASEVQDAIALVSAERFTLGLNTGDIYAAIEINNPVEVKETKHATFEGGLVMRDAEGNEVPPKLILINGSHSAYNNLTTTEGKTVLDYEDRAAGEKSFRGAVTGGGNTGFGKAIVQPNVVQEEAAKAPKVKFSTENGTRSAKGIKFSKQPFIEAEGSKVFIKEHVNPITGKSTGKMEIDKVETPKELRGQGRARKAMKAALDYTDSLGKDTYLAIAPRDLQTTEKGLKAFYSSLGYREISDFEMVRKAKPIKPKGFDDNGEPTTETLFNYINSAAQPLSDLQLIDAQNAVIASGFKSSSELVNALEKALVKKGVVVFDKAQMEKSGTFNKYEISKIMQSTELQKKIKDNFLSLKVTDAFEVEYDTNFIVTEGSEVGDFGKQKVKNPAVAERELSQEIQGVGQEEVSNVVPPQHSTDYANNPEFREKVNDIAENTRTATVKTVKDGNLVDKVEPTAEVLDTVVEKGFNAQLVKDINFLTNEISGIIWNKNIQKISKILGRIKESAINNGLDLKDISTAPMRLSREEILGFLDSTVGYLADLISSEDYAYLYNEMFGLTEPQTQVIRTNMKSDVVVDSTKSEYDLFEKHGLVRKNQNTYRQTEDTDLETLYSNFFANKNLVPAGIESVEELKDYVKKNVNKLEQDGFNINPENLEKMFLFKSYFNFPLAIKEAEVATENLPKLNNTVEYLTTEFVVEFNKFILETENPYFKVTEKGIELTEKDDISKKEAVLSLPESLKEDLAEYNTISKTLNLDLPLENPVYKDVDPSMENRVHAVNNPNIVKKLVGDYFTVEEGLLAVRNESETIVRTPTGIYEMVYENGNVKFYNKLPQADSNYKTTEVEKPYSDTNFAKYNYLETTPEVFKKSKNFYSKAELEDINQEHFDCQ